MPISFAITASEAKFPLNIVFTTTKVLNLKPYLWQYGGKDNFGEGL